MREREEEANVEIMEESKEEIPQDKSMPDEPDVGIQSPNVRKSAKDIFSNAESGLLQTSNSSPDYLLGEFFGTDFNFIYSREM